MVKHMKKLLTLAIIAGITIPNLTQFTGINDELDGFTELTSIAVADVYMEVSEEDYFSISAWNTAMEVVNEHLSHLADEIAECEATK